MLEMKTMKELVTITVADPTAVHNNKKPDSSGAWHDPHQLDAETKTWQPPQSSTLAKNSNKILSSGIRF